MEGGELPVIVSALESMKAIPHFLIVVKGRSGDPLDQTLRLNGFKFIDSLDSQLFFVSPSCL